MLQTTNVASVKTAKVTAPPAPVWGSGNGIFAPLGSSCGDGNGWGAMPPHQLVPPPQPGADGATPAPPPPPPAAMFAFGNPAGDQRQGGYSLF